MAPAPLPPWLTRRLLSIALHPDDRDCAVSDLDEEFASRAARDGRAPARRWYRDQARRSVLPALRRRVTHPRQSWRVPLALETRWAWRAVRARGAGAAFLVGLVALAIAANAIVFAAADSFVFRRAPYPNASRLIVLQRHLSLLGPVDYVSAPALLDWRAQRDLFAAVHGHTRGASLYLTLAGVTEVVRTESVTPGLFEAIGAGPAAGRLLQASDARPDSPPVALISETLARRLFGSPEAAIDRRVESGADRLLIVGVMPASFRYPTSREEVWRPLDVDTLAARPNARSNNNIRNVALLAPGQTMADVGAAVRARAGAIAPAPGPRRNEEITVVALSAVDRDSRSGRLFAMLAGAAVCLLLIACLNVTSLELAGTVRRARAYAVQTALGASRGTLLRTALLEGALLSILSAVVAYAATAWGTSVLASHLPTAMVEGLSNAIDLDLRVFGFMTGTIALVWLLTSLPSVWRATRPDVAETLRRDPRSSSMSRRSVFARQWLMAAQVALTVLLLVCGLLYVRTYVSRVAEAKGFDSSRLASLEVFQPAGAGLRPIDLQETLAAKLKAHPAVDALSVTWALPPSLRTGIFGQLEIDGRRGPVATVMLSGYTVDPEYFGTLGLRLQRGRWFTPADDLGKVVVDEAFARRFWPDGEPLGARFHIGKASFGGPIELEIAGIAGHVRGDRDETATGEEVFVVYTQLEPTSAPLKFVVRLDAAAALGEVLAFTRAQAPGCVVRGSALDDRYAELYGDTRLAAAVTSGFGALAFVVAMAGVYGVMAFLVASRTREIGIRMALGADRRTIRRLVFGSSTRLVLAGATLGAAAAVLAGGWIESQLFGVSSTDPTTYLGVVLAVFATSLLAAWHPAMLAARVDPTVTLRAE
jgi:predicted permease